MARRLFIFLIAAVSGAAAIAARPEWTSRAGALCGEREICAAGFGESRAAARADARAEMAKYFRAEVKSGFYSREESGGGAHAALATSESVEKILEGAEIRESYEDEAGHFALASLDKAKAAAGLKLKIDALDEKMRAALKEDNRKALLELERALKEREILAAQYLFLAGEPVAAGTRHEEIAAKRAAWLPKSRSYSIAIEGDGAGELSGAVKESITLLGGKIAAGKAERRITGKVEAAQEKINVEGFEKWRFSLMLSCEEGGEAVGTLTRVVVETGRNYDQARAAAMAGLKRFTEENIFNLI